MAKKNKKYDVGYGKPPAAARFKAGQSGNPGGRPKGVKNRATLLREVAETKVPVTTPEGRKRLPMLQAVLYRLAVDAANGDVRKAALLLDLAERWLGPLEDRSLERGTSIADEELIARFVEEVRKNLGDGNAGPR